MNHPPIPPNCPYFSKLVPGLFHFEDHVNAVRVVFNVRAKAPFSAEVRHIIACVVRCAWLDEATADQDALLKMSLGTVPDETVMENLRFQIGRKLRLADKWRKWGEAKEASDA